MAENVPTNSSSSSFFFFIKSFCYLQVSPSTFTTSSCVMYSAGQPLTVLIYLSVLASSLPHPPCFPPQTPSSLLGCSAASICICIPVCEGSPSKAALSAAKRSVLGHQGTPFPSGLHPGTLQGCQINTSALSSSDEVIPKLCSAPFLKIFP